MYEEIFRREIYKFDSSREDPYIIDAGANIGMSVLYFKKLYPKAHITAFEPDKKIFDTLSTNVRAAELTDVELLCKGIASSNETRSFYTEGADGGRIASPEDTLNLQQVDMTKLSSYLNKTVDMLKIDIEGAELEVLNECKDYLGQVQHIFVEYHSLHSQPQHLDAILRILSDAGFRYYIEHDGVSSTNPFTQIKTYGGYDLQLNIYGNKKII
jgi:FkbM family methyltransferase